MRIFFLKLFTFIVLIMGAISFPPTLYAETNSMDVDPNFFTDFIMMNNFLRHHHGTGGVCNVDVPSNGIPCSFNPDPDDPTTVYKWCGVCPYGGNGICSQEIGIVVCRPISGNCPSENELCGG